MEALGHKGHMSWSDNIDEFWDTINELSPFIIERSGLDAIWYGGNSTVLGVRMSGLQCFPPPNSQVTLNKPQKPLQSLVVFVK